MALRVGRRARAALGFALALGVLVGLVLAVDTDAVLAALADPRPVPTVAAVALSLLGLVLWSEAHRVLLSASGLDLGSGPTFVAFAAGQLAKNLLPMGGATGSAVMGVALGRVAGRTPGRPAGANFAVVAAAELVNVFASVALAGLGALAVAAAPGSSPVAGDLAVAVVGVTGGVAVVAAAVWYRRAVVGTGARAVASLGRATVGRLSPRSRQALAADRVDAALAGFYGGFEGLSAEPRALLVAGGYTLLGWAALALPLWLAGLALGADVPPGLACLLVPAVGLAAFVPLPGGVGGIEVALTGLLGLWGLALPTAAAVVLLYRVVSYWLPTLVVGVAATTGLREAPEPVV